MLKLIVLSGLAIVLLSGCDKDKARQAETQNDKDEPSSAQISASQGAAVGAMQTIPLKNLEQIRAVTMSINGEKFHSEDKTLVPGSRVFNVQMGEYGRVKGSFVVVMKDGSPYQAASKEAEKVDEIARDTFRITPAKAIDFMAYYQQLQQQGSFSVVEMEIDYSGPSDQAEY